MKKCSYCGKEYPDDASVCAIDQEPLESDSPPPANDSVDEKVITEEAIHADEELEVPEGFSPLGRFDAFEAARLLRRFEEAGIQFLIDKVDKVLETGRGIRKQALIEIYVQLKDHDRASKMLSEDWKL